MWLPRSNPNAPDLVCGVYRGDLIYHRNTGTATNFNFQLRTGSLSPFDGIIVDRMPCPAFYDPTNSGVPDLILGGYPNNRLLYYKNTGTMGNPQFTDISGSAADPFKNLYVNKAQPTFIGMYGGRCMCVPDCGGVICARC